MMVVVGTKIDRMKRMKRPNAIAMLAKGSPQRVADTTRFSTLFAGVGRAALPQ